MASATTTKIQLAQKTFEDNWKQDSYRNKVFKKKQQQIEARKDCPETKEYKEKNVKNPLFNGMRVSFGSPIFYCKANQIAEFLAHNDVIEQGRQAFTVAAGEYVNEHMDYWLHKQDTEVDKEKDKANEKPTAVSEPYPVIDEYKKVIPSIHISEQGTIGIKLFSDMLVELSAQGNIRLCQLDHMAVTCLRGQIAIQHPYVQIDSQEGGHLFVNMCQGPTARTLSGVLKMRSCAKPYMTPSSSHKLTSAYQTNHAKKYITNVNETIWNVNTENGLWEENITEEEWFWAKRDDDMSQDLFMHNHAYHDIQAEKEKCVGILNGIASYIVGHNLNVQVPLNSKYIHIEQDMRSGAVNVTDVYRNKITMQPEVHSIQVRTCTTTIIVQSWARVSIIQADVELYFDQGLDSIHIWHGPLVATFDLWGKAIPPNIQNILARLPPWINGQDIPSKKA